MAELDTESHPTPSASCSRSYGVPLSIQPDHLLITPTVRPNVSVLVQFTVPLSLPVALFQYQEPDATILRVSWVTFVNPLIAP